MPAYVTATASGKLATYDGETMIAMFVDADGKAAIEAAALANGTVDIATLSELTSFELARTTFTAEADETLGKIDVAADESPTADTDGDTVAGIVIARQTGGSDAARTVAACHTWTARPGNTADAITFSGTKGFGTWTPAPGNIVRGIGLVRPDAEGIINTDELAASLDIPDGSTTTGSDVAFDALPSIRGVSRSVILSDADRITAGLGEWLDGTAGRIAHPDGTVYLFSCELDGTANVIVRTTVGGTDEAPTITGDITRAPITGVPAGADALGGTVYYDAAEDQLLMVTHTNRDAEDIAAAGNVWSCVGIAKSTDWGETGWTYLGDVATPEIAIDDPLVGGNVIGSFSTYVIDTDPADDTDYIVIFHADQQTDGTVVAQTASRCPLDDFLTDCAADTAPTFAKWTGYDWSEPGLGGTPGPLYGTEAGRAGSMNHAQVLSWPAQDIYLMHTSEPVSTTTDAHLTLWSRRPEGPWMTGTDPWAAAGDYPGVGVFQTMYGSDPERPWEIQADGIVRAYEMHQAAWGSFDEFDITYAIYEPSMATTPVWAYDDWGLVLDLDVLEYVPDPADMGTTEAPVAGRAYLSVGGVFGGLLTTDGVDWFPYGAQPPIGGLIAPNDYLGLGSRAFTFIRTAAGTYVPSMPMSGGGGVSLGTTSTTAHRGDHGASAYTHSQLTTGNPHNVTKAEIGVGGIIAGQDEGATVSATTTETTLLDSTPTVTAAAGEALRITMGGTCVQNSGGSASPTLRLKLGGSTVLAFSASLANSATTRPWEATATIRVQANGDANASGTCIMLAAVFDTDIGTHAGNLSAGQALNVTWQHPSATNCSAEIAYLLVERVRSA